MSKYELFSGPYFPAFGLNTVYLSVFSPNAGKYGPEKTPLFTQSLCETIGRDEEFSQLLRHCAKTGVNP